MATFNNLKRKRDLHDDIPWTATRCSRLLRSISSRIQILRKLALTNGSSNLPAISLASFESSQKQVQILGPALNTITDANGVKSTEDPDWLPGIGRAKIIHKYGGRKKTSEARRQNTTNCEGSCFRTPFLRRLAQLHDVSPANIVSPDAVADTKAHRSERRGTKLPIKPLCSAEEAQGRLVTALSNLLANTTETPIAPANGARSLFSMCLRKVPDYIQTEMVGFHQGQDNTADLSAEIYTELESHWSNHSGGWDGLRELVRSHGVRLICDALREGLLRTSCLEQLLVVCKAAGAVDSLQDLLRASLSSPATSGNRVQLFIRRCIQYRRKSLMFQCLAQQLYSRDITFHEIAENEMLWQELIDSLVHRRIRAAASQFLEATLSSSLASGATEVSDTGTGKIIVRPILRCISLITALAGMLPSEYSQVDHWHHFRQIIHRAANEASLRLGEICGNAQAPSKSHLMALALLMSSFLLRISTEECMHDLDLPSTLSLAKLLDANDSQFSGSNFTIDVAQNISKLAGTASGGFMERVLNQLVHLSSSTDFSTASTFARQLALTTAFQYAEWRNDRPAVCLAEEIEEALSELTNEDASLLPSSEVVQHGRFRWEESISEWIPVTPWRKETYENDIDVLERDVEQTDYSAVCLDRDVEQTDDSAVCLDFDKAPKGAESVSLHLSPTLDDEFDELLDLHPQASQSQARFHQRGVVPKEPVLTAPANKKQKSVSYIAAGQIRSDMAYGQNKTNNRRGKRQKLLSTSLADGESSADELTM